MLRAHRIQLRSRHPRQRTRRPRGIALVMVLAVVGVASILGMAMLASASLSAQVKSNNVHAAHAQYLAESGVSIAMYYLHNPAAAPVLDGQGVYPGQANVGLRAGGGDLVDIDVRLVGEPTNTGKTYDITTTGRAGPSEDSANGISRQARARLFVQSGYVIDRAASFAGNFVIPPGVSIAGNVRCDGVLTNAGGTVSGGAKGGAQIQAMSSNIAGWIPVPAFPTRAVPTPQQLAIVSTLSLSPARYTYTDATGQSRSGYAQEIDNALPISALPPASPNNPLNVWFARDNDIWLADCDITGTIVTLGTHKVVIAGAAHVHPAGKLPAIVALGGLRFCADLPANSLAVDGLVYLGGSIDTTAGAEAEKCTTTIHGALMMASTSASISDKYLGTIGVSFDAAHLDLPDLTSADQTPLAVKVLQWGM